MIVLFRTLEILAIFSLLGVPFSLFFLSRIRTRETTRWVSARFLLAPATGFAVFAIYTSIFFATRHPVAHAVTAFCLYSSRSGSSEQSATDISRLICFLRFRFLALDGMRSSRMFA